MDNIHSHEAYLLQYLLVYASVTDGALCLHMIITLSTSNHDGATESHRP